MSMAWQRPTDLVEAKMEAIQGPTIVWPRPRRRNSPCTLAATADAEPTLVVSTMRTLPIPVVTQREKGG